MCLDQLAQFRGKTAQPKTGWHSQSSNGLLSTDQAIGTTSSPVSDLLLDIFVLQYVVNIHAKASNLEENSLHLVKKNCYFCSYYLLPSRHAASVKRPVSQLLSWQTATPRLGNSCNWVQGPLSQLFWNLWLEHWQLRKITPLTTYQKTNNAACNL